METIFEQPPTKAGRVLKKRIEEAGIDVTVTYVEADQDPKLLISDDLYPYTGYEKIESYLTKITA